MPRVVTVDTTNSTVTVFPASIEDDGVESATVTVTLLNTDGNPMPTRAVTISSTGSGNTITQPVGVTNQQGVATGSIVSTGAGAKTISAATLGVTLTDTASLSVQTAGGTVATFTDISRDASNTDGGDLVLLTVSTIVGTPEVRFDGILASDITVVNATTISCRVPANPSAGVCDVVCGGVGLTNPRAAKIGGDFEYLPVATTTWVDADFEGGTIPSSLSTDISSGASLAVTTVDKYSGTYSLLATVPSAVGGRNAYAFNNPNVHVAGEANGVYTRHYAKYPAATVANLGDQIKSFLFRRQAGSGQPAWIMQGIGPDFPDGASSNTFVSFIDQGILNINGTPNQGRSGVGADVWVEWVNWQSWDAGTSTGRCKQWVNGQLLFDVTSASLGSAATDYRARFGIPFAQNPSGTCEVYVDEIFVGNGFPNAVEP